MKIGADSLVNIAISIGPKTQPMMYSYNTFPTSAVTATRMDMSSNNPFQQRPRRHSMSDGQEDRAYQIPGLGLLPSFPQGSQNNNSMPHYKVNTPGPKQSSGTKRRASTSNTNKQQSFIYKLYSKFIFVRFCS
jgi:hypothetical protein